MNKRQIVASLNKIANTLDNTGLYQESSAITNVMNKIAQAPSDFQGDLKSKNEKDENKGRNIVRAISRMIMSFLIDEENAKKDFSGGELQSFVLSILDVFMKDGMQEAIKEINKSLKKYGVMIVGEEMRELGNLFNNYKNMKN
jgi:recombinational DNA repair ATPase RecF